MSSEVKANKISPATGTTTTLGDASDVFQLPASAEIDIASGATLDVNGTLDVTGATVTGLSAGKVLQVVQVIKTDGFSTGSSTHTDITGISASITPSSSSNKILVNVSVGTADFSAAAYFGFQLVRDSTDLGQGTVAGQTASTFGGTGNSGRGRGSLAYTYLDSPSSTSSLTYKLQVRIESGNTIYINYRNAGTYLTTSSTITLMEIEG